MMIRKIKYSFLALAVFLPIASLSAWPIFNWLDFSSEFRVSYFHPTSKEIKETYSHGWATYEIQFSKPLCWNWHIWAGVSGFQRDGKMNYERRKARLELVPLTLGLKYYFPFTHQVKFFIAGAFCYSFINIKEHTDYFKVHDHKSGWGGSISGGLEYPFWQGAYFSLFAEGFIQEFKFRNPYYVSIPSVSPAVAPAAATNITDKISVDVSGWKVGIGLGYRF